MSIKLVDHFESKIIIEALQNGEVVAIPTDTIYGLCTLPKYSSKLYLLKKRPEDVSIALLVGSLDQANSLFSELPNERLLRHFWPGPLTVVGHYLTDSLKEFRSHDSSIGVRLPDHDFVRELALQVGPIPTTSANLHGNFPCTTPDQIVEEFSKVGNLDLNLVVNGGECNSRASTVLDLRTNPFKVLREGSISEKEIVSFLASS